MKPVPKEIKSSADRVAILWSDGHRSLYLARDLRWACRCAACVDEWTHEALVRPERVPLDVKPARIQAVGNYALQFVWSDGHATGIYSYDYLREICECDACKAPRSFSV